MKSDFNESPVPEAARFSGVAETKGFDDQSCDILEYNIKLLNII